MPIDLAFRRRAVRTLTDRTGCYVLCDLDEVPIYVGQSTDGIRSRVNRHLTSARSDIIANRQIDVWEIDLIETTLYHEFHPRSPLMNGKTPKAPERAIPLPEPFQRVQVMADPEIQEKRDPSLRLPRQAEHYSQIVAHFLAVKQSKEIAGAMEAHFQRLKTYHRRLLGLAVAEDGPDGDG